MNVQALFEDRGAILRGHFKLSSGKHSDTYLQCAKVLEHPHDGMTLGTLIARSLDQAVDVVVAPAMGGLLIGYAVANALDVRFVFAERADGVFALRRGQRIDPGERCLVVEDVVTTGGSAAEVVGLLRTAGAEVVSVASIVDRSPQAPPFPLISLLRVEANTWDGNECPKCAAGEGLDAPGSRYLQPKP